MIVRLGEFNHLGRVLIRPGPVRRWLWPVLLPLLAGLLGLGAYTLGQRPRFEFRDGILLCCFGIGAFLLIVQSVTVTRSTVRMPGVTLLLSPAGLTLHVLPGPGTIPWTAIEAIGLVRDDWQGQTAGLRLHSYDEFEGSRPVDAPRVPLADLRQQRGYEIQIPRRVLDRSLEEFLELLDQYLERYGQGSEDA